MMYSGQKVIGELEKKLQQDMAVSDKEIFEALSKLHIQTNTLHAAFLIATAIAPICGYRPYLTKQLLPRMLYPLTLSGVGSAQQVVQWIQANLNAPQPWNGMSQVGLDWLKWLTTSTMSHSRNEPG